MLQRHAAMLRFCRTSLVVASLLAMVLRSETATAQSSGTSSTTTPTMPTPLACGPAVLMPTVTVPADQLVPERFIKGVDVGTTTRPLGEIQTGISYADCIADMVLEFKTIVCGFTGQYAGTNVEIWASTSSSCTADTDRGHGGVGAVCWPVGGGSTDLVATDNPQNYNVRVQDIVGRQASPGPTYQRQGPAACNTQPTSVAVPITVNFIPVNSSGLYVGSGALQFPVTADLVGPPAPTGVGIKDGDTLFVVNWTPNVDTDTAAYDIVMDPAPGGAPSSNLITELVCPDAAAPIADAAPDSSDSAMSSQSDTGSASDAQSVSDAPLSVDAQSVSDAASAAEAQSGGQDATTATTPATASDAGCRTITVVLGSAGESCNVCSDPLLSGGTTVGGTSSTTTTTEVLDDAGNVVDSAVVGPTNGGIWTPPAGHVLNPNATTGSTITGQTNSTYTITGLTNAKSYTVVVAAVDNYGNVGPPSTQACDCPAPVTDFWKTYRTDGGGAGGGFCALEAVGAPAGSTVAFAGAGSLVVATLRRRRRKKR